MERIEHSVEVDRDVRTVYDQWTQFEEFPRFMDGVERVVQEDDQHLTWHVSIAGVDREWRARITEQEPDRSVAWQAEGEVRHDGRITFHELGPDRTRVDALVQFQPEGVAERIADATGVVGRRVRRDLENFKEFIEKRGVETGAWRGEVHTDATKEPGATSRPTVERDPGA